MNKIMVLGAGLIAMIFAGCGSEDLSCNSEKYTSTCINDRQMSICTHNEQAIQECPDDFTCQKDGEDENAKCVKDDNANSDKKPSKDETDESGNQKTDEQNGGDKADEGSESEQPEG